MKKQRTDSLEYIAKKHKQEQEEYLKAGVVKRVALYAEMSRIQGEMRDILKQEMQSQKMLKDAFGGIGYGIDGM